MDRPGTEQRAGGREAMTVLRPKQAPSSQAEASLPVIPALPLPLAPELLPQQKGMTSQRRRIGQVLGAKVVSTYLLLDKTAEHY